jgi:hypothetical protein
MVKRKENPWQFKFSFALAILMLLLVFGYFTQSCVGFRQVEPGGVGLVRGSETTAEPDNSPKIATAVETENGEVSEQ